MIPEKRSPLARFGGGITIGDDYYNANDWFIYRNGKKLKRYLSQNNSMRVWPPHLLDLPRLARLERKTYERYLPHWHRFLDAVRETCRRLNVDRITDSEGRSYELDEKGNVFLGRKSRDESLVHPEEGDRVRALELVAYRHQYRWCVARDFFDLSATVRISEVIDANPERKNVHTHGDGRGGREHAHLRANVPEIRLG